jgi:chemotaxis protein MotA
MQSSPYKYSRFSASDYYEQSLDRGVVGGLVFTGLLLLVGFFLSGTENFLASPLSLILVLGGTIGATLIQYNFSDFQQALQSACSIIYLKVNDPRSRILFLVQLAQKARKQGILVLEEAAQNAEDSFLKTALGLAVDTSDPEDLRRTLDIEVASSFNRSVRPVQIFEAMGTYSPALGLIGTLIGLIQMLGALNDPATVGPAMGVALITTLYGAVLANMLFIPIAGKLKLRAEEEALVKSVTIEGIIAVIKQENPLVVEQRLQTFIPESMAS